MIGWVLAFISAGGNVSLLKFSNLMINNKRLVMMYARNG